MGEISCCQMNGNDFDRFASCATFLHLPCVQWPCRGVGEVVAASPALTPPADDSNKQKFRFIPRSSFHKSYAENTTKAILKEGSMRQNNCPTIRLDSAEISYSVRQNLLHASKDFFL